MSEPVKVPTIGWYIDNEWDEGDGLPGPAYRRRYGVEPHANDDEDQESEGE
jgi:hypothetical protein